MREKGRQRSTKVGEGGREWLELQDRLKTKKIKEAEEECQKRTSSKNI